MVLGRAVFGCLSRSSTSISRVVSVCKSIQQTRTRFHTGSGSNTPDCRSSFLRIAYYLFTVLSAVLTIGSLRGERITLPTETYSTPLRSGASSPTFIYEVVRVGVLSSGIFCCIFQKLLETHLTEPLPVWYNISTKKARLRRTLLDSLFENPCSV
jgi:hypothetical protein